MPSVRQDPGPDQSTSNIVTQPNKPITFEPYWAKEKYINDRGLMTKKKGKLYKTLLNRTSYKIYALKPNQLFFMY